MISIDINCDLGEGIANEKAIMPLISSCNIACGGHVGTRDTIQTTLKLAALHDVKIGAHPSYPDKVNFGRKVMKITQNDLKKSIFDQISMIIAQCDQLNLTLHHVKAHGALYNESAKNQVLAQLLIDVVEKLAVDVYLFVPYGTAIHELVKTQGIKHKAEAFADRNYKYDLSLVPRKENEAMLAEAEKIAAHLLSMIKNKEVKCIDGETRKMKADTFCFHGDQIGVEETLKLVQKILLKNDVNIK